MVIKMFILSADTAAKTASVCVSTYAADGVPKPLAHACVNGTLTHSESLLPMIDFCLKNAGISFAELSALAVSVGPGSFTGVRIGVSTMKGLAFSNPQIACIGVSTLEALAYNLCAYSPSHVLLPLMDARRNQYYNAFFRFGRKGTLCRLSEDALLTYDELAQTAKAKFAGKKILLTGDGAELFYKTYRKDAPEGEALFELCDNAFLYEDAFSVARCALARYYVCREGERQTFSASRLNPVYLRASQAEREKCAREPSTAV